MERNPNGPEIYDYRRHDRLWQRVGPGLEPYPDAAPSRMTEPNPLPGAAPAPGEGAPAQAVPSRETRPPGAEPDPCCMGSAAAELLAVLEGYIEEELEEARLYRFLARQAPGTARRTLLDIAGDEEGHARRLMAVYYLITGETYRPRVACGIPAVQPWQQALRQRYHGEACTGLNYARSAESTTDVCLAALLRALSADEYRHAEQVLALLEQSLRRMTC